MANYHFEIKVISRGKGHSITSKLNYISGQKLYDLHNNRYYCKRRDDVLFCKVFQPSNAPPDFSDLQFLCNAIDKSERRYDARTGREYIGSLPNELPIPTLIEIVEEYVNHNFIEYGLCVVAAIHEGRNEDSPSRNNPHVHMIVSTRTVGPDGFNKVKDREHNDCKYVDIWREEWANIQNRAYERHELEIRVSHESLEVQGKYREPVHHISYIDWQKEERSKRISIDKHTRVLVQKYQSKETRNQEIELLR